MESVKTTDSSGHYDLPPGFRELAPDQFWGGSVVIPNFDEKAFVEGLLAVANESGFRYSGYITKAALGQNAEYHMSRYPRKAFGPVPPVTEYQNALKLLGEKFGLSESQVNEEKTVEQPRFRVLLGLQEGYAEWRKKAIVKEIKEGQIKDLEVAKMELQKRLGDVTRYGINLDQATDLDSLQSILESRDLSNEHSIDEVKDILGKEFDLTPSEICSASSWGTYREPSVVIEGDIAQIPKVYLLAEKFRQARFAVENLQTGESHMVETSDCEDPDKE